MPKLVAMALVSELTLQDPFPTNDKLVIRLPAPATGPFTPVMVETQVSRAQLERLRAQMVAHESSGRLRWYVEAAETDERSQEFGYEGLPMLSFVDAATTPVAAAGVTGGIITGTGLLGGQVKDNVTVGDEADPNNWMRVELLTADPIPSGDHNTRGFFTLQIVDAGVGNPQAVNTYTPAVGIDPYDPTFVPAVIILESDFANVAHTWATLGALVNALGAGTPTDIIRCAWDVGTDQIVAATLTERSSGLLNGFGHSLVVAGVPATINFIDDTTIDYDVGALTPALAGDFAMIDLRTNNKLAQLSVTLA